MRFRNGSWELYAETFGAAGDPALLLLHGAGNSMTAWDAELCERLAAQGRHVVRLDSRDAGKSARADAPGAYSLHDLAPTSSPASTRSSCRRRRSPASRRAA